MGYEDLKEAMRFLRTCLLEKDMTFAKKVLTENLLNSVTDPEALWTTYYRLCEDRSLTGWCLPGSLPEMPVYNTSMEDYDSLMGVLTGDR